MIAIDPAHWAIIAPILRHHLPPGTKIWVFGSRAKGTAHPASDLDLAIDAGAALDRDLLLDLKELFEASDLPYRVDLVDWHELSDGFRTMIESERRAPPP